MCGLRPFDDHLDCRIIVVEKIGDDCWILVRYMGHSQWFLARVWMFLVWVDAKSFFWKDRACDRRLARPNRYYIHHTGNYRQYCYVRNKASDCKLGLIQDSDWAGDTKSTSGKVLCISKAKPLCQFHGQVVNILQCHTAAQKLKWYFWTLVLEWKDYLLWHWDIVIYVSEHRFHFDTCLAR